MATRSYEEACQFHHGCLVSSDLQKLLYRISFILVCEGVGGNCGVGAFEMLPGQFRILQAPGHVQGE